MSSLEDHIEDEGIVDLDEVPDLAEPLSGGKKGKKKRDSTTLRKAPQAPKRFKSSYICFFMAKQPEIKAELGEDATVTSISKRSAEMWKHLPPEERAYWDDVAAKDKQRYMTEKATYTGPWQVPWKRVKKDPSAPRRPMSAFLFYSIGKRQQIKEENPEMKNTEISRVLGEMWRSLSEEERRPFVEKEKTEREKYKVAIAEWRKTSRAKQEAQRKAAMEQQQNLMPSMHEQPVMYPDHYGAPAIPVFYPGYPAYAYPPTGPYQFPTNGKHPVILGANGMPVASAGQSSKPEAHPAPSPHATMPPVMGYPQGYEDGSAGMPGQSFDYGGEQEDNRS